MSVIFSLILILLGVLTARDYLGQQFPQLRPIIDKLTAQGEYIGAISMLFGIIWMLVALSKLILLGVHPVQVTVVFLAALETMTLGMIFGLPLFHKFMNEPTPGFLLTADKWSAGLHPYHKPLGLAAIILGLLSLVS